MFNNECFLKYMYMYTKYTKPISENRKGSLSRCANTRIPTLLQEKPMYTYYMCTKNYFLTLYYFKDMVMSA